MGCDIHMHFEVKIAGVWHHYSAPRVQRSYALFTRMAGVQSVSGVEPIAEPRGLPDDISFLTKLAYEYDGDDGHSHSWLSGKEIEEVCCWNDEWRARQAEALRKEREQAGLTYNGGWYSTHHHEFGYLFGNGWDMGPIEEREGCYPPEIEDARLVFWFDN